MESVGDVIKRQTSRFQYQDLVQQIMKDPDVAAFIQKESPSVQRLNQHLQVQTNISQNVTSFFVGMGLSAWLQAYLGYESRLCGCVL